MLIHSKDIDTFLRLVDEIRMKKKEIRLINANNNKVDKQQNARIKKLTKENRKMATKIAADRS